MVQANRAALARHISATVDSHVQADMEDGANLAGVAVLVWSSSHASTASVYTDPRYNKIPAILIPDFVRNRLLHQRIETWTVASVKEMLGIPS